MPLVWVLSLVPWPSLSTDGTTRTEQINKKPNFQVLGSGRDGNKALIDSTITVNIHCTCKPHEFHHRMYVTCLKFCAS